MAKPSTQETIVDLSDEQDTPSIAPESTTDVQPTEQVQNLKESYEKHPEPTESAGKGKKYCPNCYDKISARYDDCPNCGWHFYKGAKGKKRVVDGRTITTEPRKPKEEAPATKNKLAVWQVIKSRGYNIKATVDVLEPNAKPVIECDKEVQALVDFILSDGVELLQSSPKIKYAIGLDELFALLKVKPRK